MRSAPNVNRDRDHQSLTSLSSPGRVRTRRLFRRGQVRSSRLVPQLVAGCARLFAQRNPDFWKHPPEDCVRTDRNLCMERSRR